MNPPTTEEREFTVSCSELMHSGAPGFATLMPPDGEVIEKVNEQLKFRDPGAPRDSYEVSIVGNLSSAASKIDALLELAGVEDCELRDSASTAVTRRVAGVIRALNCDTAYVIVTCRLRRGTATAELSPHIDSTFDPTKGPHTLAFKAVSVLTAPTTKFWPESEFDREKFIEALTANSPDRRKTLEAESIAGSNPLSLKQGEILIFKAGDPEQATLHTIPAFPAQMDRLVVQINPLPFESIGEVWFRDQVDRVKRTFEALLNPDLSNG